MKKITRNSSRIQQIDPIKEGVYALVACIFGENIETPEDGFKSLMRPDYSDYIAWKTLNIWSREMYLKLFKLKNETNIPNRKLATEIFKYADEKDVLRFCKHMNWMKQELIKDGQIEDSPAGFTKDCLIELLISKYNELERMPKAKEFKQYRTVKNKFNSWNEAKNLAIEIIMRKEMKCYDTI